MKTDLRTELEDRRITRELLFSAFIGSPNESDDPRILERLVEAVYVRRLAPGDVLFKEGDATSDVYFMSEGRIRLTRPGAADWIYEGRWVIGSADAFLDRPRNRTCVAETPIVLFGLESRRWFDANQNKPEAILAAIIGYGAGVGRLRLQLAPDGGFVPPSEHPPLEGASTFGGRARILAGLAYLKGISAQVVVELARSARVEVFEAGAELLSPDAPADRIFVVARGLVEIRHEPSKIVGRFGPGDVVGGSIFLNDANVDWRARAVERSELITISVSDLGDLLEENLPDMRVLSGTAALERERLAEILAERRGELRLY